VTEVPIRTAELLAVGSELTSGRTVDTDSVELAGELTRRGVRVRAVTDLPDDRDMVTAAIVTALGRADLVVTTGGLGPTPDDLTREAIADACGETPSEDPTLLAWLQDLFERRGRAMPPINRKQAWLIPSARALPNGRGTAPGWWVERPDGRLLVALPGPPREMAAMWLGAALPRLLERDLGEDRAVATLRLTGIGESDLAALIGEARLRAANPAVATYARDDAVDVQIEASAEGDRSAAEVLEEHRAELEEILRRWIFAHGQEGWPEALGRVLGDRRLATVEIGTGGRLVALLGDAPWLVRSIVQAPVHAAAQTPLEVLAVQARHEGGAEIGLVVRVEGETPDSEVEIVVADAGGVATSRQTVFLTGSEGRRRAALAACATLWRRAGSTRGPS
jgi:competence/damage-inducible protein CinA-like protein